MSLDKISVMVASILGIGFIYWFFLAKKEKATQVSDSVDIIVDGGYSPGAILIAKDKTVRINFIRKDPSSCLEEVILADFKLRKQLPLNQKVIVELTPHKSGEFTYTCAMNMYHGKIIVK